jgi:hypothetical protein
MAACVWRGTSVRCAVADGLSSSRRLRAYGADAATTRISLCSMFTRCTRAVSLHLALVPARLISASLSISSATCCTQNTHLCLHRPPLGSSTRAYCARAPHLYPHTSAPSAVSCLSCNICFHTPHSVYLHVPLFLAACLLHTACLHAGQLAALALLTLLLSGAGGKTDGASRGAAACRRFFLCLSRAARIFGAQ